MKKMIVLAFVLLLGGCSTKFAYNNVNWLIYWYLDDYIELNKEQEDMFDDMLVDWKTWHVQQELPKYHSHLGDIIEDIENRNINEVTIAGHRERAREHWIRARAHVAPDLVALGKTLSDEQVSEFFDNLEEQNVDDEKEIAENAELKKTARVKKWVKSNQKGIRKWMGKLTDEQKDFIGTFYQRFESTGPHWLAYKRDYQRELKLALSLRQQGGEFDTVFHELIVAPEQYRSDAFVATMDTNTLASTQYMMGLVDLASEQQISSLIKEISDLQDDVASIQK